MKIFIPEIGQFPVKAYPAHVEVQHTPNYPASNPLKNKELFGDDHNSGIFDMELIMHDLYAAPKFSKLKPLILQTFKEVRAENPDKFVRMAEIYEKVIHSKNVLYIPVYQVKYSDKSVKLETTPGELDVVEKTILAYIYIEREKLVNKPPDFEKLWLERAKNFVKTQWEPYLTNQYYSVTVKQNFISTKGEIEPVVLDQVEGLCKDEAEELKDYLEGKYEDLCLSLEAEQFWLKQVAKFLYEARETWKDCISKNLVGFNWSSLLTLYGVSESILTTYVENLVFTSNVDLFLQEVLSDKYAREQEL